MTWKLLTIDPETGAVLEDICRPFDDLERAREFKEYTQRFVRNVAKMAHKRLYERPYGDNGDIAMCIEGGKWAVVVVREVTDGSSV